VFAGLGKHVSIGQVSADICEKSYSKSCVAGKAVALEYANADQCGAASEFGLDDQRHYLHLLSAVCFLLLSLARNRFDVIIARISHKMKALHPVGVGAFVV